MECAYHPCRRLSHFCPGPCLLPLCVECLSVHQEKHPEGFCFQKLEDVYRAVFEDYRELHAALAQQAEANRHREEALCRLVDSFTQQYAALRAQALSVLDGQLKALEDQLLASLKKQVRAQVQALQGVDLRIEAEMQAVVQGIAELSQPRSAVRAMILFLKEGRGQALAAAVQTLRAPQEPAPASKPALAPGFGEQLREVLGKLVSLDEYKP
jgi:hypothetical protein